MSHHYETADFGEPLDLEDSYRVTAYRHGDRVRYRFERLDPPITVTRPEKTVDFSAVETQTKGRPTT